MQKGDQLMKKTYKYAALALFALSALAITAFTFQNSSHSAALTMKFVNLFERVHFHFTGTIVAWWPVYHMMRKFAHTIEYFFLGLTACFLFNVWGSKHYAGWALATSATWSLIDQTSKLRVPGREFDPTDFPFDIAGYILGIGLAWVLTKTLPMAKVKISNN